MCQEQKKQFEEPNCAVVRFDISDIISSSDDNWDGGGFEIQSL